MDSKRDPMYYLSRRCIIILVVYFAFLLILGCTVSIYIGCTLTEIIARNEILHYAFLASSSVSSMLCGVQYIRKLYRACFSKRICLDGTISLRIGTMVYFLCRPLFAIVFAVIAVFSLLSGMHAVTGTLDYIINEKFLYLCVIISSFIGFSIGKVLDRFEVVSTDKISQTNHKETAK